MGMNIFSAESSKEMKELCEKWKSDFRSKNETDGVLAPGKHDLAYERFCDQLEKLAEEKNGRVARYETDTGS